MMVVRRTGGGGSRKSTKRPFPDDVAIIILSRGGTTRTAAFHICSIVDGNSRRLNRRHVRLVLLLSLFNKNLSSFDSFSAYFFVSNLGSQRVFVSFFFIISFVLLKPVERDTTTKTTRFLLRCRRKRFRRERRKDGLGREILCGM
jgi:hypothetical protein